MIYELKDKVEQAGNNAYKKLDTKPISSTLVLALCTIAILPLWLGSMVEDVLSDEEDSGHE